MIRKAVATFCVFLFSTGAPASGESLTAGVIPLGNSQAYVFSASLAGIDSREIFVLDGIALRVYALPDTTPLASIALPAASSAIDVFDLDGDGWLEVVVVAGERVMVASVPADTQDPEWESVVEAPSLFSMPGGAPFPRVLAVDFEGATAIALPQVGGFDFWGLDGKLRSTVPYDTFAPSSQSAVESLHPETMNTTTAGESVSMVHRIHRGPDSTRTGVAGESELDVASFSDRTLLDVSDLPSEHWPSFPLEVSDAATLKVLFSPVPPRFEDSYIRIQSTAASGSPGQEAGPRRRYPGRVITNGDRLPDFNGDGFADLVCWKSEPPGESWNTLVTALRDESWPVQVTVHLYDAVKQIYSAVPIGVIQFPAPIKWFESLPIRNLQFRDFDKDGMLDIGLSTKSNEYSVWKFELGFPAEPSFVIATPTTIESILPHLEFVRDGESIVLLRGDREFYVVRFPMN